MGSTGHGDQRRRGDTGPDRHRLRVLRSGGGEDHGGQRPSPWKTTASAALALLLCVLLPDIHRFVRNEDVQWLVYLSLNQASHALLCMTAGILLWRTYALRIILLATAVWYLGQGVDELTDGNLWQDGIWEYPVLLVYASLIAFHLYRHATHERRGTGEG